jgi:hypothetical protein
VLLASCSRSTHQRLSWHGFVATQHRSSIKVVVLHRMFTVQTAHTVNKLQDMSRFHVALLTRVFFLHGLYLPSLRARALMCTPTIRMVRRLDYSAVGAASGAGGSPLRALRTRRRHALLLRAQHGDWRTHRCEAGGAGHPADPVGDSLLRWRVPNGDSLLRWRVPNDDSLLRWRVPIGDSLMR